MLSDTFGLRYQAQLNTAGAIEAIDLVAQGHTMQPAADLALAAAAHGLLLVDGTYHDIKNVDPVIPRIAPLGATGPYTEPPYSGPRYDWSTPAQVFLDGDGIPHAQVPLGQWSPTKATQRLFDTLHMQVLEGGGAADRTPPRVRGVSTCRVNARTVQIKLRATPDTTRAEVVLFDDGKIRVAPLLAHGSTWTAEVPSTTSARFLIQVADANGNVVFATRSGRLYTLPASTPCGD